MNDKAGDKMVIMNEYHGRMNAEYLKFEYVIL